MSSHLFQFFAFFFQFSPSVATLEIPNPLAPHITFGIGETIVYSSPVEVAGTNPNRDAGLRPPFRMGLRQPFEPYEISMQPIGIFCIFSTLLIFSYN